MSKISYTVSDQIRRLGIWLVWNPLRLLAVLIVILLVWLIAAGYSARTETQQPSEPTAAASSGLPEEWENWPRTTATPRE